MSAPVRVPSPELAAALRLAGLQPRRITLVSPLREAKGRRLAYRVDDAAGRTVKLRQFESDAAAREVFELRRGLEPAFAAARQRHGCVVIEDWIDGRPLDADTAAARAREAGALLGRLHARPLPTGATATARSDAWRRGAESDLATLAGAGALSGAAASRLSALLRDADPGEEPAALIHLDFCADNMVVDARGDLRVIDNEQLAIDSAGLDLARTWCRWPMPAAAWEHFGAGYRAAAPRRPGAAPFWRIVAAAVGARVYLQRGSPLLAGPLALLRRRADAAPPPDWCDR